jgi:hypothetical protein
MTASIQADFLELSARSSLPEETYMSRDTPSFPVPGPERLADLPLVRRGGQWWLIADSGSIPLTDRAFGIALDRFTDAMAAADRAVAELRTQQRPEPQADREPR